MPVKITSLTPVDSVTPNDLFQTIDVEVVSGDINSGLGGTNKQIAALALSNSLTAMTTTISAPVTTAFALKAPLASPSFTGTVILPPQTYVNNTLITDIIGAIADNSITNSKISATAAIALTKLGTGALPTGITVNTNNIVNDSITNSKISATAAIALTKLGTGALPTGITVNTNNIVNDSIVNDDISTTAAIALSKLAGGTLRSDIKINAANIITTDVVPTPLLQITTQPRSTSISSGATAQLSVSVSGVAPFTFQWYQGAVGDITTPVGTNSPNFTTAALNTTTTFWVKITSGLNTINSSLATITADTGPTTNINYGGSYNEIEFPLTTVSSTLTEIDTNTAIDLTSYNNILFIYDTLTDVTNTSQYINSAIRNIKLNVDFSGITSDRSKITRFVLSIIVFASDSATRIVNGSQSGAFLEPTFSPNISLINPIFPDTPSEFTVNSNRNILTEFAVPTNRYIIVGYTFQIASTAAMSGNIDIRIPAGNTISFGVNATGDINQNNNRTMAALFATAPAASRR